MDAPDEIDARERRLENADRARALYQRHAIRFALACALVFIGRFAFSIFPLAGVVAMAGAACCWITSGRAAMQGGAHLLGLRSRMSNDTAFAGRSRGGARAVGVVLIVIGIATSLAALRMLLDAQLG